MLSRCPPALMAWMPHPCRSCYMNEASTSYASGVAYDTRPPVRAEGDARAALERSTRYASRTLSGVPDALEGEEGEAVTDGLGADEAQGSGVAGLAEETLAGSEHDRVDRQP